MDPHQNWKRFNVRPFWRPNVDRKAILAFGGLNLSSLRTHGAKFTGVFNSCPRGGRLWYAPAQIADRRSSIGNSSINIGAILGAALQYARFDRDARVLRGHYYSYAAT